MGAESVRTLLEMNRAVRSANYKQLLYIFFT